MSRAWLLNFHSMFYNCHSTSCFYETVKLQDPSYFVTWSKFWKKYWFSNLAIDSAYKLALNLTKDGLQILRVIFGEIN